MRYGALAAMVVIVLAQGCTSGGGVEKAPSAAVEQPAALVEVDEKKLWRNEYEPLEGLAISKQDLPMLNKFAKIRYNTAIASYNDAELRKHLQRGSIDARLALEVYEKGKKKDTREYADLLQQLALYEEKLGDYRQAQEHMEAALAQKLTPPRDSRSLFWAKTDLARIYIGAHNDAGAARVTDELMKEFENDPKMADTKLVVWREWIDAHEHVPGKAKEVDRKREELEKMKTQRAKQLENEASAALKVEKDRER